MFHKVYKKGRRITFKTRLNNKFGKINLGGLKYNQIELLQKNPMLYTSLLGEYLKFIDERYTMYVCDRCKKKYNIPRKAANCYRKCN